MNSPKPDLTEAQRLLDAGFHLVPLHHNEKRPVGNNWNTNPPLKVINPEATGVGLPLVLNGLCSVDPDHYEMSKVGVAAWGFDLDVLLAAGVQTESTRPNSGGRSAFSADPDNMLSWLKFVAFPEGSNNGLIVLELRAKSDNLQDVCPGLVYADKVTGELFSQRYANGKTFDDKPSLPADFLKFWRMMSMDDDYKKEQSKKFIDAVAAAGFTVSEQRIRHIPPLSSGGKLDYPAKGIRGPFNRKHEVESLLELHGYQYHSKDGRWSHPGATGAPGIRAIKDKDGLWQSDHGGDPLSGTFDAWVAHVQLGHGGNLAAAIAASPNDLIVEADVLSPDKPHPLTLYRPPVADIPMADDMLIEGILCAKVSFLGAYAGAGKTTAMVPLVLIVAGLVAVDGMEVLGWRNVIYISEHPEQFELSLKALIANHNLDPVLVASRIKVVTAVRMAAKDIVKAVPDFEHLSASHTKNNVTVDLSPWVVIDTQAATLHLESENDTAEASAAMAILKTHFDSTPLTIVAHTAKAHKRGDAEAMTIRGAGSFESDCNQVLLLSYEADSNQRFVEIGIPKHRFTATVEALAVEFHTTELNVMDRFERVVRRSVGFCTLSPVSASQKVEIQGKAKEAAEEAAKAAKQAQKDANDMATRMAIKGIVKAADDAKTAGKFGEAAYLTRPHLVDLCQEKGFGRTRANALVKEMIEAGDSIRYAQVLDKSAVGLPKNGDGNHIVMRDGLHA